MERTDFENQYLVKFSIHTGGDMRGSVSALVISLCEDDAGKAKMILSEKNRHDSDFVETVYLVDRTVLSEIKEVFWKYEMYSWNEKKPPNSLMKDGKLLRYSFIFTEGDVSFSVQRFEKDKSAGLKKLDKTAEKFRSESLQEN